MRIFNGDTHTESAEFQRECNKRQQNVAARFSCRVSAGKESCGLSPAEPLQREAERNSSPEQHYNYPWPLVQEGRAFQNAGAQRVVQRRKGQSFDEGMNHRRKAFVREKDARE